MLKNISRKKKKNLNKSNARLKPIDNGKQSNNHKKNLNKSNKRKNYKFKFFVNKSKYYKK